METTFAMIKPNGVERGLIGEIISRFERKGLTITGLKLMNVSEEQAKLHYEEHNCKPFYEDLLTSITNGPVVCLAITGNNAIALVRKMAGATNPIDAEIGTIRGDFSSDMRLNVIHTSDSQATALRELEIYFDQEELIMFNKELDKWIYS